MPSKDPNYQKKYRESNADYQKKWRDANGYSGNWEQTMLDRKLLRINEEDKANEVIRAHRVMIILDDVPSDIL